MKFNDVQVTREELVAAARYYRGMRYDAHHTLDGISTDCAGFMMLTVRRCGLTDPGCEVGLTPARGTLKRAIELANVIADNYTIIPVEQALPGDLLRFNFDDVNGRHFGFKSSNEPPPLGSIIHGINGRVTDEGAVIEQRIDPLLAKYLFRAYRLNQWMD